MDKSERIIKKLADKDIKVSFVPDYIHYTDGIKIDIKEHDLKLLDDFIDRYIQFLGDSASNCISLGWTTGMDACKSRNCVKCYAEHYYKGII